MKIQIKGLDDTTPHYYKNGIENGEQDEGMPTNNLLGLHEFTWDWLQLLFTVLHTISTPPRSHKEGPTPLGLTLCVFFTIVGGFSVSLGFTHAKEQYMICINLLNTKTQEQNLIYYNTKINHKLQK
ncbi:hypothetical protein ACJX0J_031591 [Zea mays]